jgi:radical SAM protein with 4Fe4S-binding SPASM domain
MNLLSRVVVPCRLALICRGSDTLGYNPNLNTWEPLSEQAAELLRWLRAGRDRMRLADHIQERFGYSAIEASVTVRRILEWCVLRRMLYLDEQLEVVTPTYDTHHVATVYWVCTQACNLRCTYCYQSAAHARSNELSTAEAMTLVDQTADLGAEGFIFTGGEPFVRSDLLEIARYARGRGLGTSVITNGHYIDASNAGEVARLFDGISVSLDSGTAHHHDSCRGKGSWEKAAEAIDLLLAAGATVDVNSVLTHLGLADVQELIRFVRSRRIREHRIVPQFPMGRGSARRSRPADLTPSEVLSLNTRLRNADSACDTTNASPLSPEGSDTQKMVRRTHCGAGLGEVSVDPEGWVFPCRLLQYPRFRTDNVRNRPLREIVDGHPTLKAIRATVVDRLEPCKTCIIKYHCGGGCRGIQFSFTQDYLKAHPLFCAYLRSSFEEQAWNSSGLEPKPRRAEFAQATAAGATKELRLAHSQTSSRSSLPVLLHPQSGEVLS